jgi:hypothetical protein
MICCADGAYLSKPEPFITMEYRQGKTLVLKSAEADSRKYKEDLFGRGLIQNFNIKKSCGADLHKNAFFIGYRVTHIAKLPQDECDSHAKPDTA